jgi:transposase InsO family protein
MELWQMDVVGGIVLADGTELKALTGIDDHSRFCVCAGLMEHARARPVCGHFVDAMREHGVPDEVLTDNGKVFTGRHSSTTSEVLFDRICRQNGITHRLTGVRSPDHHREDRAVPPHPANGVPGRSGPDEHGRRTGRPR